MEGKLSMEEDKVCFNCAFCSESYSSFVDTCDVDDHVVRDVCHETCENFLRLDEE